MLTTAASLPKLQKTALQTNAKTKATAMATAKTMAKTRTRTMPKTSLSNAAQYKPKSIPWIDENQHPYSGDWIARTVLRQAGWPLDKGGKERGKDYNHSTFVDLILTGLFGLRPKSDEKLDVNPLVPITSGWAYFCVDRVKYHGRWIRVQWDATGERYKQGKGLRVYVDGQLVATTPTIQRMSIVL